MKNKIEINKDGTAKIYAKTGAYTIFVGLFKTAKDAGVAYDKKAISIFGDFAKLNFPAEVA